MRTSLLDIWGSAKGLKMRLIDVWLVMLPVGLLILAIMLRLWSVA
jgi:hypothetical protein